MTPPSETEVFLRSLLDTDDGALPGAILIWTFPAKLSYWCTSVEQALAAVSAADQAGENVYLGIGLADPEYLEGLPQDVRRFRRAPKENVRAMLGFGADIDIAGEGHKGEHLLETEEKATALIEALPMKPTLIVHTGGGLHAWWIFEEPWELESEGERRTAERRSRGWSAVVKDHAADMFHKTVDSVWDLARVLRIPGTSNRKGPIPRPVRIVRSDGPRYQPSDFERWEQDEATASRFEDDNVTALIPGDLILDRNAEPPGMKLELLLDGEPKAKQTWLRRRRDLADQSPSAYDQALANLAAFAGWTAQEITDLLIAYRKKHDEDLKLKHRRYYRLTVGNALAASEDYRSKMRENETAQRNARRILEEPAAAVVETEDEKLEDREQMLDHIRRETDLPVIAIWRIGVDDPQFELELKGGLRLPLGNVSKFRQMVTWEEAALLAKLAFKAPPKPNKQNPENRWKAVILAASRAAIEVSDEETSRKDSCLGWVRELARSARGKPDEDMTSAAIYDALQKGWSYFHAGALHFRLNALLRVVKADGERGYTKQALSTDLNRLGYTSRGATATNGKATICKAVYRVPAGELFS